MRPDASDTICPIFTSSWPRVDAERLDRGEQARHLRLVVRAPHVDHAVVATDQELVAVVGDVASR